MQYFQRIAAGVDVVPVLLQLKQARQLWDRDPFRTAAPQSPHREAHDIICRAQVPGGSDPRECVWYTAWTALPALRPHVVGLMARVEGLRLGRVLVTRLVPGAQIYPHRDYGPQADGYMDIEPYWSRFHLCLDADAGSVFGAGTDVVSMAPGEVWWFDGGQQHWVANDGQVDRLHLIVDIHCGGAAYDGIDLRS